MHRIARKRSLLVAALACATLASCQFVPKPTALKPAATSVQPTPAGPLVAVDLSDAQAAVLNEARLASARNETVGLAVRLTPTSKDRARKKLSLRIAGAINLKQITAYQVVPMPAATNGAAYVRHTGSTAAVARLPGALVPLDVDKEGRIQLSQIRENGRVGDKERGFAEPITLWFDVHVPAEMAAGEYAGTIELMEKGLGDKVVASLPVKLGVDDFVLPDERHLLMVSRVEWETLYKHWPKEFEAITPRLLNRDEPRHAGAVHVMDQIAEAAQRNRVQVVFGRVQPTVKWPAGSPPRFDWTDYDTVVAPWLSGEGFADKVPYGYWPLPKADGLERYDRGSRMEYWQAAATHFDQKDWLSQATVLLDQVAGTSEDRRVRDATAETAEILRAHTKVRVTTPLPVNTLDVAEQRAANGQIDLANAARVGAWAPGLVSAPRTKAWPRGIEEPRRFLQVGMTGTTPYVGVGETERDVRQWAWLAFVQQAGLVLWGEAVPKEEQAEQPADAGEQVWFYPGSWFGVDRPVETVQLKWARRAAQDYEYLWLAKQRGEVVSPEIVARLLSKPVEVRAGQGADPVYALVSGTVDQGAWEEARRLVARAIALALPGQRPDERLSNELGLDVTRWTVAHGRPTVMARGVRWVPGEEANWLDVQIGLDVYGAAEDLAEKNSAEWAALPAGWQARPRPVEVLKLVANQVRRVDLEARFNLDRAGVATISEGQADFVSGYNGTRAGARFVLPVGVSERHEGRIKLDGELSDWNELDAVQNGPLVRMLSQPGLKEGVLARAGTPSSVCTGWGEDSFYVAFKVGGVSGDLSSARNFVEYQQRRAWGEDLCEVMMQGVYGEGVTGPVVHLVLKPNGQWVERKSVGDTEWSAVGTGAVLYAGKLEGGVWRGEVAVPWKLVNDVRRGRPSLVRFNFVQHKGASGESASWAGPVDYGRDESLMGLVVLREGR